MEFKKFGSKYVVRLDKGDEILNSITEFCKQTKVSLGNITGIGACDKAVLGVFDCKTQTHIEKEFSGHYEISSLLGNITNLNGEPFVHAHICLSGSDYSTIGGHLHSAVINIIGEIIIDIIDGEVGREFNSSVGAEALKF